MRDCRSRAVVVDECRLNLNLEDERLMLLRVLEDVGVLWAAFVSDGWLVNSRWSDIPKNSRTLAKTVCGKFGSRAWILSTCCIVWRVGMCQCHGKQPGHQCASTHLTGLFQGHVLGQDPSFREVLISDGELAAPKSALRRIQGHASLKSPNLDQLTIPPADPQG
jgi:hypothetical protein